MNKKNPHNRKGLEINNRPLDFDNPEFWHYLQGQKTSAEADRNRNTQNVNETERTLCSQIMLFTTVLLTGSVFFLGDRGAVVELTTIQRVLILSGLIFLFTSAILGILYFFKIMTFFERWAFAADKVADVYNDREFSTWKEATDKLSKAQADVPTNTKTGLLVGQLIFLGLAGLAYMGLIAGILFDLRFLTNSF